jgi:hypothetical protein
LGTPCWTLPKSSVAVVGLISDCVPVPVRVTPSGLPAALCEIESEPFCDAAAVGVKVVVSVQLAPGASEVPTPQVLLAARVVLRRRVVERREDEVSRRGAAVADRHRAVDARAEARAEVERIGRRLVDRRRRHAGAAEREVAEEKDPGPSRGR